MKKQYITPVAKCAMLDSEESLLSGSQQMRGRRVFDEFDEDDVDEEQVHDGYVWGL